MPDLAPPATEPKRRALGRGLDALLPPRPGTAAPKPPAPPEPVSNGKPLDIDVSAIDRNPFQTRTQFDEVALSELAQSITFNGVVQPIVVRALSGGQRQVVAISRALHFNARVLIMDEPTAALGPEETRMVHELIRRLKAGGVGVFLISHDLPDVFALADRLAVMKNGRMVGTYRTADLTEDEVLGMIIAGKSVTRVPEQHRRA